MNMLREILQINKTADNAAELQKALQWLETDPWAGLVNESAENSPALQRTINTMETFLTGSRVC